MDLIDILFSKALLKSNGGEEVNSDIATKEFVNGAIAAIKNGVSEEYDTLKEIEDTLTTKLSEPSEGLTIGNYLCISNLEKNHISLEGKEFPIQDIKLNNESLINNNIANIPIANNDEYGVIAIASDSNIENNNGYLNIKEATEEQIVNRLNSAKISLNLGMLDFAVKTAMTDKKGLEWTNDEQLLACSKIGAASISKIEELVTDKDNATNNTKIAIGVAEQNIEIPTIEDINPLYGKKNSVNGDGICQGVGYSGGYAKIIAENNNMTFQNIANDNGTIVLRESDNNHCISQTISMMDLDSDYIILEGGLNDAILNSPLGVLSEGYNNNLDYTTYYGAFEYMLRQLINRFHDKKYGYIAIHQIVENFSTTDNIETSYYYAAKKCCEKWGVPFLDLNTSCPPIKYIPLLSEKYTLNGEGKYLNKEGYIKYYTSKIESWLKTL